MSTNILTFQLQEDQQELIQEIIMTNNFTFGHTLNPVQVEESSQEDLEQLFKIGDRHIQIPKSHISIDSDSTPNIRSLKEKKLKKHEKKKKDRKEKHNNKKKKHRRYSQLDSEQDDLEAKSILKGSEEEEKMGEVVLFKQKKDLTQRKERLLSKIAYADEADLFEGSFSVGKKIGDRLLSFDIVSFGFPQLYDHGLMDKDIPQYSRLQFFDRIVGAKLRQQKLISKSIAQKLNQKLDHLSSVQRSQHRYYNYQGYENIPVQNLSSLPSKAQRPQLIPFSETLITSAEDESLRINRDLNVKLNLNPHDVNLWLRFARIQKQQSCIGQANKNRGGLIDRQLSIIEKAISFNPRSIQLVLNRLELLAQKQTESVILQEECHKFIKMYPQSTALWKLYLKLQLSEFHLYSHPLTRKKFEQITQLLRSLIDSTRSAVEVWKVRKAGLQLVKNMALIYKLQGYGQLATGLIVGLIDFNFNIPEIFVKASHQERIAAFAQYWQNQSAYKLGQLPRSKGWLDHLTNSSVSQQIQGQPQGFISSLGDANGNSEDTIFERQIRFQDQVWRPSHPVHDRSIIRQRPDSYVLIEDIEFALHLYRDASSLVGLLDLLADHLQLPEIFMFSGYKSQFGFSLVKQAFLEARRTFSVEETFYWWKRFWNPLNSEKVLSGSKAVKLEYLRRVLEGVRDKLLSHHQQVVQYLIFINCCYLCSPNLRKQLGFTEADVLSALEALLAQGSPHNVSAWSIYIQTTHQLKQNTEECIDCYLQLLDTNSQAQQQSNATQLSIIYQLWLFMCKHKPQGLSSALRLYLCLLDHDRAQISLGSALSTVQKHRLSRYLQEKMAGVIERGRNKQIGIEEIQLCLLVLDCWSQGYLELIRLNRSQTVTLMGEWMLKAKDPFCQHYLVCEATRRGFIRKDRFEEDTLFSTLPYIQLVSYWLRLHQKPIVTILSELQLMHQRNLPLWMVCFMLIQNRTSQCQVYQEYFLAVGKQLCFEGSLSEQSPQYIVLLSRLLLEDANEKHSDFIQYSLKQIPYAKELYLLALITIFEPNQRAKILALMQEKGIRILHSELLHL